MTMVTFASCHLPVVICQLSFAEALATASVSLQILIE